MILQEGTAFTLKSSVVHDEWQSQSGDNYGVLIEVMGLVQLSRPFLSFQIELRGRLCACHPAAEREHCIENSQTPLTS